jgi:hypothetical protein
LDSLNVVELSGVLDPIEDYDSIKEIVLVTNSGNECPTSSYNTSLVESNKYSNNYNIH